MTPQQLCEIDREFARAIGLDAWVENFRCFIRKAFISRVDTDEFPAHADWNLVMPEIVKRGCFVIYTGLDSLLIATFLDDGPGEDVEEKCAGHESPNQAAIIACMRAVIAFEKARQS